jgi:hypothetical protein
MAPAPFHAGDVTSAIQMAQKNGVPLLVALLGSDLASATLDAEWGDASSPLHAELTATGSTGVKAWVSIRLVDGTPAAAQFTQLFPCNAFPAVIAINPINGG